MNTALVWAGAILFVLGWVLAALGWGAIILHTIRQHAKTPAPAASPRPVPGKTPARAANPPPPGPAPNRAETDILNGIQRARITAPPQAISNSRLIADGLRLRLPHLDDASLGLAVFDLAGYINAAVLGYADPGMALGVLSDGFTLAAEELTRLARNGVPR